MAENRKADAAEWDTVSEESPTVAIFDKDGDVLEGNYEGVQDIEPENGEAFSRYLFRNGDGLFAVNQSYKLKQEMDKIPLGSYVRLTRVKEIPTKRGLNPMIDFKIQVRR